MVTQKLIIFICIAAYEYVPAINCIIKARVIFLLLLFWCCVTSEQLFDFYRILFVLYVFIKSFELCKLFLRNLNIVNKFFGTTYSFFVLLVPDQLEVVLFCLFRSPRIQGNVNCCLLSAQNLK